MNLRKSTNAASAEKKLILPPAHMRLDKSSHHFLPRSVSWQKMDHSGSMIQGKNPDGIRLALDHNLRHGLKVIVIR